MGYSFMDVKGYSRNLKGSLFRFFPALWHCFYEIKVAGWDIAVNGNFACDVDCGGWMDLYSILV